MKVEIEMETNEEDESVVMEKVSELTRQAKEMGFAIEEIELKRKEEKHEREDDEEDKKRRSRKKKRK